MNHNVFRMLALFNQFAMYMLVPIFICCYGGYWLDRKFQTNVFFVLFFFVGAAAGGRNIYLLAKKAYDDKETRPSERYAANRKRTDGSKQDSKE